jgi:ribose/xylose/arabinose/galactoside ABC-type transport system permease subunit
MPTSLAPQSESRLWRLLRFARAQLVFILLVVIGVSASLLSDVFLTPQNLINIVFAASVIGVVSMGQTLLILTGDFDMSVASVIGFAGILAVGTQAFGLLPSIMIALLGGVLVGLANGVIVTRTRANPFLVTLGMQSFIYALALMYTQSRTLYSRIPDFNVLGRGAVLGVPLPVVVFLGLAVLLQVALRYSIYGRFLYAIGSNREAARLSGVPVDRIRIITFMVCGVFAALAGIIMTSRLNSTVANAGTGFEFESIIAVVLGGSSLFGGSGGTMRTVAGVLVLGVLNNVLVLLGVPYEAQPIVKGGVFLGVVGLDGLVKGR